jgi:hypothetical protein
MCRYQDDDLCLIAVPYNNYQELQVSSFEIIQLIISHFNKNAK